MIIKPREASKRLKQAIALDERIRPNHPKIPLIKENRAKLQAGYRGESALDYPLNLLPHDDYFIFRDVRLPQQNPAYHFQMDVLILTKKCWINLESKNLAGSVFFNEELEQLIQTVDDRKKAFPCPLAQIAQHEIHFRNWQKKHELTQLPIYSFVIMTNPNTLIETTEKSRLVYKKVMRMESLVIKLQQLLKSLPAARLSQQELQQSIQLIKMEHNDVHSAILSQFQLTSADIIQGIRCPKCSAIPMERVYGTWHCPKCNHKEKLAHFAAIEEFSLLIKPRFTKKEIMNFLQINCPYLLKRIFKNANFLSYGKTKSTTYQLL